MLPLVIVVAVLAILGVALLSPLRYLGVRPTGDYPVVVTVGGRELSATMEGGKPAEAFRRLLRRGPRTIRMRDYGSVEKVGLLWRWLPCRD